jgi:hypothetical protein
LKHSATRQTRDSCSDYWGKGSDAYGVLRGLETWGCDSSEAWLLSKCLNGFVFAMPINLKCHFPQVIGGHHQNFIWGRSQPIRGSAHPTDTTVDPKGSVDTQFFERACILKENCSPNSNLHLKTEVGSKYRLHFEGNFIWIAF